MRGKKTQFMRRQFRSPTIETKRLKLQHIALSDLQDIIEISSYDGLQARDHSQALQFFKQICEDQRKAQTIHWGIYKQSCSTIIGTCGFYRGFKDNMGEIGYILKPDFRGYGFMAESVRELINFAENTLKLRGVFAITSAENLASQRVLMKSGLILANSIGSSIKFEMLFRTENRFILREPTIE